MPSPRNRRRPKPNPNPSRNPSRRESATSAGRCAATRRSPHRPSPNPRRDPLLSPPPFPGPPNRRGPHPPRGSRGKTRPAASIGWAWFEREPADGRIDNDEVTAESDRGRWIEGYNSDALDSIPEDAVNRDGSWWNR